MCAPASLDPPNGLPESPLIPGHFCGKQDLIQSRLAIHLCQTLLAVTPPEVGIGHVWPISLCRVVGKSDLLLALALRRLWCKRIVDLLRDVQDADTSTAGPSVVVEDGLLGTEEDTGEEFYGPVLVRLGGTTGKWWR